MVAVAGPSERNKSKQGHEEKGTASDSLLSLFWEMNESYLNDMDLGGEVTFEIVSDPPFAPDSYAANVGDLNSPFSQHSDLSFDDEFDHSSRFGLFGGPAPQYDPTDFDNPSGSGMIMFNDDYLSTHYDDNRSRASSLSSHNSPQQLENNLSPSPRMQVAQSLESLSFNNNATNSPQQPSRKPNSPPRLMMPDNEPDAFQPPVINAPDDSDAPSGPRLHIVPATPVSGGGAVSNPGEMPFCKSFIRL